MEQNDVFVADHPPFPTNASNFGIVRLNSETEAQGS